MANYSRVAPVGLDETQIQMDSPTYSDLEGEIASTARGGQPTLDKDFDTLDEPIWHTVKRDLSAVGVKFAHVLYPKRSQALLRDWDLWGPLFLCVFISLLLQGSEEHSKGPQFTEVFVITFFGACIVTFNIKLLGGTISFFQSLCVLGYCLLPPGTALILCKLVSMFSDSMLIFWFKLAVTALGFTWATFASTAFLSGVQPPRRKALAVYPIFLFYFVVSWLIISHTH